MRPPPLLHRIFRITILPDYRLDLLYMLCRDIIILNIAKSSTTPEYHISTADSKKGQNVGDHG